MHTSRPGHRPARATIAAGLALTAVAASLGVGPAAAVGPLVAGSPAAPSASAVAMDGRWGVNGLVDLGAEADRAADVLAFGVAGGVHVLRDVLTSPARTVVDLLDESGQRMPSFGTDGTAVVPHVETGTRGRFLLRTNNGALLVVLQRSTAAGAGTTTVVKLEPWGPVDERWGTSGALTLPGSAEVTGATLDAAGRLHLSRNAGTGPARRGLLHRVTVEGRLDTAFGTAGTLEDPVGAPVSGGSTAAWSVAPLPTGGVAVVGEVDGDGVLARLDDAGAAVPDFGTDGRRLLAGPATSLTAHWDGLLVGVRSGNDLRVVKHDISTGEPVLGWGSGAGTTQVLASSPCRPYVRDTSSSEGSLALLVQFETCAGSALVRVDATGAVPPALQTGATLDHVRPTELSAVSLAEGSRSLYLVGAAGARGAVATVVGAPVPRTRFVALPPARLADTRLAIGVPKRRLGPGGTLTVRVTGDGGVPAYGAESVTLNVTAVAPTADSFITVHPSGTPRPTSSNLNLVRGVTTPAQVVARPNRDGRIDLYNAAGTVDLLVDVAGYTATSGFMPSGGGAGYRAVTPSRVLDTRTGTGASRGAVGPRGEVMLDLAASAVPRGTRAVVLNVTAVNPTAASYVTVWPDGFSRADTSSLNVQRGVTVPNLVTVALNADGRVRLYNHAGSVHLVADLAGYYTGGSGDDYVPLAPLRIADSRRGLSIPAALHGGGSARIQVAGSGGVPDGATAVVLNVTGVSPSEETHLTVAPADGVRPLASNLNLRRGVTQANLVVVGLGPSGGVAVHNNRGSVHVVADVAGYFIGPAAP